MPARNRSFAPVLDARSISFAVHRPFVSANHQYMVISFKRKGAEKSTHRIVNTKEAEDFKRAAEPTFEGA